MAGAGGDGQVASLVKISLQAAAAGEYWRVQRRQLELHHSALPTQRDARQLLLCPLAKLRSCLSKQALPEEGANALLAHLLRERRLEAPQLALFAHSATVVEVDGGALPSVPGVGADWLAYLAKFSALYELRLLRCPRLRDAHLSILAPALAPMLRVLSLAGCSGLTAGAAQHLAKLTGLVSLDLNDTSMGPNTAHSLAPLTLLTSLQLGGLPTTDDCCIALARMTALERLVLWGSEVGDQGMREMEHLTRLSALDLSLTRCSSPPLLPTLCQLSMIHCQLDVVGEDREALWLDLGGTLPSLQELHLSSANFAEPRGQLLVRQLVRGAGGALRHLRLNLSNACDLSMLEGCTSLTYLDLSGAPIHDALLGSLALLPLHHLSLSDTGVTEEGVGQLLAMSRLTHLDLRNSLVGDGVLAVLAQLPGLQSLDLSGTEFVGAPVALPSLTSLVLTDSRLGDRGCKFLAQAAPVLRTLRLGSSAFSDAGLRALARLPQLTSLMLDGGTITDIGLRYLSTLTGLKQLHLNNSWLLSEAGVWALLDRLPELGGAQLNGVPIQSQQRAKAVGAAAVVTAVAVRAGTPVLPAHTKAGRGGGEAGRQQAAPTTAAPAAAAAAAAVQPAVVPGAPLALVASPALSPGVQPTPQRLQQQGRVLTVRRVSAGGGRRGRFVKLPEDLLQYDERIKYSKVELLVLQRSPAAAHARQEVLAMLPLALQLQGEGGLQQ